MSVYRVHDAFFDNTICKEQVLHKVVEVRVWGDDIKQMKKEHKNKKDKKNKR